MIKLAKAGSLRFSDLKISGVESNAFTYHLKKLLKQKLIIKEDANYKLTTEGKRYIDSLSGQTLHVRAQPKIINLIVCKNKAEQFLFYKRNKEPFVNKVAFPYGKLHLGESVLFSAERELKEKTNLEAKLKHIGDAYILVTESGEVISHSLCHVFYTEKFSGILEGNSHYGEFFWDEIISFKKEDLFPGTVEILKLVQKNSKEFFFKEITIND